jgi:hypothetical protein
MVVHEGHEHGRRCYGVDVRVRGTAFEHVLVAGEGESLL